MWLVSGLNLMRLLGTPTTVYEEKYESDAGEKSFGLFH